MSGVHAKTIGCGNFVVTRVGFTAAAAGATGTTAAATTAVAINRFVIFVTIVDIGYILVCITKCRSLIIGDKIQRYIGIVVVRIIQIPEASLFTRHIGYGVRSFSESDVLAGLSIIGDELF